MIPLDVTRLKRIGVPEDKARHSDWDQIGKSFTAVRGIGYVVWYPVATESADLSEGNTVFETVGRWKAREAEANLKIKLTDSGQKVAAELVKVLCNGKSGQAVLRTSGWYRTESKPNTRLNRWYATCVPLFVIGRYDMLERPSLNTSFLPGHKSGAENYALAADLAVPTL